MADTLYNNVNVMPGDAGRATVINNCIEDIFDSNDGAFNVDIMHASKILAGDSPNIQATKLSRINDQLRSADTNIRWLLENYLIDENNTLVIRAHNCINTYNTDVRLRDIYQVLNHNTKILQKMRNDQIPLDRHCRLEDRPDYSNYMTQFDLSVFQRIVLVDFRNIYCGVSGMQPPIVEGLQNACDQSRDLVDYTDENILIFENYLYNQIAYRDPNTLYIVIKSNNGSRIKHGFAALTNNLIEYTLNLEKGAHTDSITFVEYDDYTLIGLYIILSRYYARHYNLMVNILSGDKYNWYTPININANAPQRRYVQNVNPYYELSYYSPRRRAVLFSQTPAFNNRYVPPNVRHRVANGSLRDLFSKLNFISSAEIIESDRLYSEYQQTIGNINDIVSNYLQLKVRLRQSNNNTIQPIEEHAAYAAQLMQEYHKLESDRLALQSQIGQLNDLSLLEFAQHLDQSIADYPKLLTDNRAANTAHFNKLIRTAQTELEASRRNISELRIKNVTLRSSMRDPRSNAPAIYYKTFIGNAKLNIEIINNSRKNIANIHNRIIRQLSSNNSGQISNITSYLDEANQLAAEANKIIEDAEAAKGAAESARKVAEPRKKISMKEYLSRGNAATANPSGASSSSSRLYTAPKRSSSNGNNKDSKKNNNGGPNKKISKKNNNKR